MPVSRGARILRRVPAGVPPLVPQPAHGAGRPARGGREMVLPQLQYSPESAPAAAALGFGARHTAGADEHTDRVPVAG